MEGLETKIKPYTIFKLKKKKKPIKVTDETKGRQGLDPITQMVKFLFTPSRKLKETVLGILLCNFRKTRVAATTTGKNGKNAHTVYFF